VFDSWLAAPLAQGRTPTCCCSHLQAQAYGQCIAVRLPEVSMQKVGAVFGTPPNWGRVYAHRASLATLCCCVVAWWCRLRRVAANRSLHRSNAASTKRCGLCNSRQTVNDAACRLHNHCLSHPSSERSVEQLSLVCLVTGAALPAVQVQTQGLIAGCHRSTSSTSTSSSSSTSSTHDQVQAPFGARHIPHSR
jgi:hypothetical protein